MVRSYDQYTIKPFRKLSLRDLLGQEVDYEAIADLCQIKLYQTLTNGGEDFVENSTTAEAGNLSNFYVDKDGVTFLFQPYQVAPYSEGMPEVTLSWSELKRLVKPSAPWGNSHGQRLNFASEV